MFLCIDEKSVARAWISSMQQVFFDGDVIRTQYDTEDDFPSRDCSSAIRVAEPLSEPFSINGKVKLFDGKEIYCHPADVYCIESIKSGYLSEVMTGAMDHLIWEGSKSYPYTYHDRLFNYKPINREDFKNWKMSKDTSFIEKFIDSVVGVDQIAEAIKQLKKAAYTRRAQAVTWRPLSDNDRDDGPCLQRLWFRIFGGKLRMNAHWRSRDLFGAWEANVNGMIQIGKHVAKETGSVLSEYVDFCDSLHIYGKQKKVFLEVIPMFERVRNKDGLLKPDYGQILDEWVKRAGERS